MNWYLDVLRNNYANFEGRAKRKKYWMFTLFNPIIFLVLIILISISMDSYTVEIGSIGYIASIILVIYSLGIIVPSIAVTIKHLHDIDKSGWWYLISFVPFGGIVLFVFSILDGTPSNNRFGPDPKA
ncbi:DUF805 domain-containing protein [Providencia sp. SP181]|uniref:DUF805 domain-containing protein n=1 Tax=Providencia sp. SP181 TaxID=3136277 RepID=UPI003D2DA9A5